MNYLRIYNQLIDRSRSRHNIGGYTERHHIIPRSMGGTDDLSNIAVLTGREHFIAHLLLARIYPNTGMVHAAYRMACANRHHTMYRVTSRLYENLRAAHAHRVSTDEVSKLKKSIANKGRKQSKEHIEARNNARKAKGPWHTEEAKLAISEGKKGKSVKHNKGAERTPAQKAASIKSAATRKGRKMLPEQVARSVESRRGKSRKPPVLSEDYLELLRAQKSVKVTCPHCSKEGASFIMQRWHFDNCKKKV